MKHTLSTVFSKHWGIVVVFTLTPLLLYASSLILPTFDDWTSLTSPSFEPLFTKETFLFYGYHWRPFDAIIGYILGLNPHLLFPTLNHCLVVFGHAVCALLLYYLLTILDYPQLSKNIATAFFFITPAAMATVLAVDSMNQAYSLIWGITSFLLYTKLQNKTKYLVWGLIIFIATLCKENGLMWVLICPILAYGYDLTNKQTLKKDIGLAIAFMVAYALVILISPKEIIIHPEYVPDELKVVKNFIKFIFTTFVTIDYVWLLHLPSRNLLLAAITLLLTIPFFYGIYIRHARFFISKRMVCTLLCLMIAVSPHILTVFSMMHTYSGLPFIAIIIAEAANRYQEQRKPLLSSFALFILTAIIVDIHLWYESWQSGLMGKKMATEVVKKTGNPVKHVYLMIVEEDHNKLSSFCVVPYEAFGWGLATKYETNYKWPETIRDTLIERTADYEFKVRELGIRALEKHDKYDCVWIVDHDHIEVIK